MMKMYNYDIFIFGYLILVCSMVMTKAACTCKNPVYCQPIRLPMPSKEVFAFITSNNNWKLYDWDKITTIATFTTIDPDLVCFAHSKGARVVYGADFPKTNLTNEADRHKWVGSQINKISSNNLDGINVDFEETISISDQPDRDGLSLLMLELYSKLKVINPYYQITFDIPNHAKSQRNYDYSEMAWAVDFFFIMDYAMSGRSHPGPNSPLNQVEVGIQSYIKQGISASKLLLGAPWYGFDYPCTKIVHNVCSLANSAKSAGYAEIMETYYPMATGSIMFDDASKSPFFNYKDKSTGQMHQLWFDNAKSLSYKYAYAASMNMRGVGMWTADFLDYGNTTQAKKQREEIWATLPKKGL